MADTSAARTDEREEKRKAAKMSVPIIAGELTSRTFRVLFIGNQQT
ncbi:MAG TPA: hypothetical protein VGK81_11730 [Anaerolineae bacterium]